MINMRIAQRQEGATENCIQSCLDCHRVCLETLRYCLQTGDQHSEYGFIRLLLDCANLSQMAAKFMLLASEFHPRLCELCALACERCVVECAQFTDDERIQHCATICRQCAETCQDISTIHVG